MRFAPFNTAAILAVLVLTVASLNGLPPTYQRSSTSTLPSPPEPEPIVVVELPMPPVTPNEVEGGCTSEVNPRRTGCIGAASSGLLGGNFSQMESM